MEIDSPWLLEGDSSLLVNGVDVVPLVDAELNRRFPGRELRTAEDPEGLRAAWSALERTWAATVERATAMPDGTIDASVDGEWSLGQTLRHLVIGSDTWLDKGVHGHEQPYHPVGLPTDDNVSDAYDDGVFAAPAPSFAEILEARGDRQTMMRTFLAGITPEVLAERRQNPHAPDHGPRGGRARRRWVVRALTAQTPGKSNGDPFPGSGLGVVRTNSRRA